MIAPDDDRAARRLTNEVEQEFKQCVENVYFCQAEKPMIRTAWATCLPYKTLLGGEQLFSVTSRGALGFATHACYQSTDRENGPLRPFFNVDRFSRDLINFLSLAAIFYGRFRYYGSSLLDVNLRMPDTAQVWQSSYLFAPPSETIRMDNAVSQMRVSLHPLIAERWQGYLEAVVNDLVRFAGRVLSQLFRNTTKPEVEVAITRLKSG